MEYLPVFLRLEGAPAAVIGGGEVAWRKVQWLRRAGARVRVIAPRLQAELAAAALAGELEHRAEHFRPEHLEGARVVVAATGDTAVNAAVAATARAARIPVNVVDDAQLSSFIFPAIIDRSPIVVAVSSAGHAPVLARRVRAQIEALLPARLGALARFLGIQRERVRRTLKPAARRAFWERLLDGPVARALLEAAPHRAERALRRELHEARRRSGAVQGSVHLVGAGPGDPDLLTLRALQLLQEADVILHDRLVSAAVLERSRRDAQRIFVGKEAGERGQQERINALLVSLARAGKRVVRLKGGDPFIFGRGGEELEVLAAHGIPCSVVPGITAALGAAAAAQLPLTHRHVAASVTFVSGHVPDGALPDWRFFANPQHTVVFYMGIAQLESLVARLRAAGALPGHPVALIERATLPGERVLRGTLADIVARARAASIAAPALLVSGAVAAEPALVQLPALAEAGAVA
ncbi:MAG: uroporphyrinogen-III C-methyltransferase [Gammaproteobacteria bacterium]|nr:uroporphyrinogen-III C-methyltransferase [Gammaproteobacteria bacterium]